MQGKGDTKDVLFQADARHSFVRYLIFMHEHERLGEEEDATIRCGEQGERCVAIAAYYATDVFFGMDQFSESQRNVMSPRPPGSAGAPKLS